MRSRLKVESTSMTIGTGLESRDARMKYKKLVCYGMKLEREQCGKKGNGFKKTSQTTTETGENVKGMLQYLDIMY